MCGHLHVGTSAMKCSLSATLSGSPQPSIGSLCVVIELAGILAQQEVSNSNLNFSFFFFHYQMTPFRLAAEGGHTITMKSLFKKGDKEVNE